jgi:hypothetical protein
VPQLTILGPQQARLSVADAAQRLNDIILFICHFFVLSSFACGSDIDGQKDCHAWLAWPRQFCLYSGLHERADHFSPPDFRLPAGPETRATAAPEQGITEGIDRVGRLQ